MSTVPTRRTSEMTLDQWNQAFRASAPYQAWMASHGKVDTGRGVQLSDRERDQFERDMAAIGIVPPSGMKFDNAGNLNQRNTLGRNLAIGAAVGAGALTGFGLAGMGPLSGLGGGAAAAGAGGATAAGSGMGAIPLGYGLTPALLAENAALGGGTMAGMAGAGGALGGGRQLSSLLTGRSGGMSDSLLSLIGGLTSGGLGLAGAKMQTNANDRAAELQAKSAADALAYAKEVEARDRAQYLEERGRQWGLEDARRGRLAPFQANGAKAYQTLSNLLLG